MKTIWNEKRLEELLKDFYKITQLRVGLFDLKGEEIIAYPKQFVPYCSAIRSSNAGKIACMECDRNAYGHVATSKGSYIYQCHAGLTEMIIPVQGHGMILGYLMIGQFRAGKLKKGKLAQLVDYWNDLGIDVSHIADLFEKLTVLEEEQLHSCAHILQACAVYVWIEDYIRLSEEPLGRQVENYITNHLEQRITIDRLTKKFYVGKTALCSAVKEQTGRTVSELLRFCRVEEAKRLLHKEELSISKVAAYVGIKDYNYFSKVFKLETGMTPSEWRKQI